MASIDPRIAMGYQGAQFQSPVNALAQVMQIRGMDQQNALGQLQMQEYQRKAAEADQQRNALAEFQRGIPSPQMQSAGNALMGGGGPTVANAQRMQPVDPRLDMLHRAMKANLVSPLDYFNAANPAPKPGVVVGEGGALVDPLTGTAKFKNEKKEKPERPPSAVLEYEYAKQQGYKGTYEQWDRESKKAGASSVSVNTGQKGLDNTLKLRGDFRSEPVYKAHQEMQSAYAQIQQSLKQASPAGDLAGATKIMKLLDPGSVVRESELGMAMAASGLLDRVVNYADRIIKGTKLTPAQRQDFQTLADALYGESVKQYNGKRSEYEGIATRNGLSVADVLGAESKGPTAPVKPSVSNW